MEGVTEVIQLHALNAKVREAGRKILRKGGTLSALVDKIRGYEADKTNEEIFKKTHQTASDFRIAAVARSGAESNSAAGSATVPRERNFDYQGQSSWRNFGNPSSKYGRNNSRFDNKFAPCWRCSSIFHVPSKCHAANKVCRNCKKTGHIERACRQIPTPSNTLKHRISRDDERSVNTKKIATVTKDEEQKEDMNVINERISIEINELHDLDIQRGCIFGRIANNISVLFLIDSGADVNTVDEDTFDKLRKNEQSREQLYCVSNGTDKPLRAYASPGEIKVVGTFVAELYISENFEKVYVIRGAKPLLGRETSLRYSVLQIGLDVKINCAITGKYHPVKFPGEILAVTVEDKFPKLNIPPVVLSYNITKPPSRRIFTNIPLPFREETQRRLQNLLATGIIEVVTDFLFHR
ncbi:uncharacterized protein LOC120906007 [Anopheles arabiensis]|uniref:uncharacterized protein LOC120906007 n=1 Tax=Anopheles arabiensis TaxID=7173 RepID=UPI001AADF940|nr:uncharacterized protein LOC120906007 [Anopheles arabiensis]